MKNLCLAVLLTLAVTTVTGKVLADYECRICTPAMDAPNTTPPNSSCINSNGKTCYCNPASTGDSFSKQHFYDDSSVNFVGLQYLVNG